MKTSLNGKRFNQHRHDFSPQSGWTLVEVLVVVVIIVILAAASVGVFQRGRTAARSVTCMTNVKQVGAALLMHAQDHNQKLIALQPSLSRETGQRPPIWTAQLAAAGYLWEGSGELPCGEGVWTCPDCDFMSHTYGGYGVAEDSVFVYEENKPFGVSEEGSLRLTRIARPENTWLVGDVSSNAKELKKGWYAMWSQPSRWESHGPAARHGGKVNVCLADGHVESLRIEEIKLRGLTENVVR